jgi:pyridinium-3,5-biscarboxylic acid mononucleotide synthase
VIRDRVRSLLEAVAAGTLEVRAALEQLAAPPIETLEFATIDHHRALRQGFPEVVYGEGKSPDQVLAIVERIGDRGDGFLVTRASHETLGCLAERFAGLRVNHTARTAYLAGQPEPSTSADGVLIVTAGTSDLPVAEEAAETATALGLKVSRLTDVGVSGIHRLLARASELRQASVVIVVAGMDGALPSVVGGLVAVPVIAVPTSVGYGASFGGVAALLTALNSCAAGVTVVNIDNGFGAAVAASRILAGRHTTANTASR